jgi:S-adenosylmethionine-diacylglycerol 3-amino-3-carboxypropyl transferase
MQQINDTAAFDFIRYANCWEDADVLLKALSPIAGGRIFSIASAGDNSFSLLVTDPEIVVAADISKVQLQLVQLKKIAYQYLSYEELLGFLGFTDSIKRIETFNAIKAFLDDECKHYFEINMQLIENGIIHQGKFEKYLSFFAKKILPWIHNRKRVDTLMEVKSDEEQKIFYEQHWNTWRWRLLFNIFFSKYVMGKYGRDPQFMKEVSSNVGETIFKQTANHFKTTGAQSNMILHYCLKGNFGNFLPHYVRPENYATIKTNLHKLHIKQGYAEDIALAYNNFNAMNLSNIFEYMSKETFDTVTPKILNASSKGARLVYWNLMVQRKMSTNNADKVIAHEDLSSTLKNIDTGFFYNCINIDEII